MNEKIVVVVQQGSITHRLSNLARRYHLSVALRKDCKDLEENLTKCVRIASVLLIPDCSFDESAEERKIICHRLHNLIMNHTILKNIKGDTELRPQGTPIYE